MAKKTVEDILEQGIYGPKEINPEERRKFLGTLRERIVLALFSAQVRGEYVQPEIVDEMKRHSGARLYLNGTIDYTYLSKYIKAANQYGIPYKMVTNQGRNTDIGLVLAYDHAIDKENIYIEEGNAKEQQVNASVENQTSFFSKLKAWFK